MYSLSATRTCSRVLGRRFATFRGTGPLDNATRQAEVHAQVQAELNQRRRARLGFWTFATGATISLASYALGSAFPPSIMRLAAPRPAPAPPDPDSPEAAKLTESLEKRLQSLPEVLALRAKSQGPDAEYYEARPYMNYPKERRVNSLTAGALRGPGRLAVPPLVFAKQDESSSKVFIHVGRGLCGHDGIVHGGLTATLLDETLARTAFLNLPSKLGVTASLTMNYRAPVIADQFIIIETKLEQLQGRKATVTGRVTDLSGKLLVEASGLFIEPKYANMLAKGDIKAAMGMPARMPAHMPVAGEVRIYGEDGPVEAMGTSSVDIPP